MKVLSNEHYRTSNFPRNAILTIINIIYATILQDKAKDKVENLLKFLLK